jgi:hypothetical protein
VRLWHGLPANKKGNCGIAESPIAPKSDARGFGPISRVVIGCVLVLAERAVLACNMAGARCRGEGEGTVLPTRTNGQQSANPQGLYLQLWAPIVDIPNGYGVRERRAAE